VKIPCRQWELETIHNIMIACTFLHNMIIEDKIDLGLDADFS
jgi:hypothetical protein